MCPVFNSNNKNNLLANNHKNWITNKWCDVETQAHSI